MTGSESRPARLANGLFVLGVGLAVSALVGPLAADLVDYPLTETLRNQTIGLDAVTFVVVAPLAIAAGLLTRRRHRIGPVLAVVVGTYAAYMYLQFLIGPDYLHYPGTLALQLGLFALGWVTAVRAWIVLSATGLPDMDADGRRRHALVAVALAAFVVVRYLPAVPASLGNDSIPEEALGDPAMFWTIFVMDLGVFVPLVAATAMGLRRGAAWAPAALYVAVGWFVLVTLAVLAMSIVMVVNDDPFGTNAQVALFALTATLVVGYAAQLLRSLVADEPVEERRAPQGRAASALQSELETPA